MCDNDKTFQLVVDHGLAPAPHFFSFSLMVVVEAPGVTMQGVHLCSRASRFHVRYQQGESDQLCGNWEQRGTQELWDLGLRASKLWTSCHPNSSLGYQKP